MLRDNATTMGSQEAAREAIQALLAELRPCPEHLAEAAVRATKYSAIEADLGFGIRKVRSRQFDDDTQACAVWVVRKVRTEKGISRVKVPMVVVRVFESKDDLGEGKFRMNYSVLGIKRAANRAEAIEFVERFDEALGSTLDEQLLESTSGEFGDGEIELGDVD